MSFFRTVRPLKSERVKKILADEKLREKFILAVKDLKRGGKGVFIKSNDEDLRVKYLSIITAGKKSASETESASEKSFKVVHVKEIEVGEHGELLNEGVL